MKHFIAGLALVLGGCGLLGHDMPAPDTAMQTLDNPQSPARVSLRSGGRLTLRLESNPTTGYYWTQTGGDEAVVRQLADDYVADPAPEGIVGSGGVQVFAFEGVAPGRTQVRLSYERSPEDVADTLVMDIEVKE